MYGIETTILLPLLAGFRLFAGRPLLPLEVARALAAVPSPRVLVSTPAHLRAIIASGVALPPIAVIICATAPLDAALASAVEEASGGVVVEMFGSTETCILGYRETARTAEWTPYPGVIFQPAPDNTLVSAPWFMTPQVLQDIIEVSEDGSFRLQGRAADLVEVAGKRASLADLTAKLLEIPGVEDAVIYQPELGAGLVRRLAAMVVAPGLEGGQIRAALANRIDPVFLPRPLHLVTSLPRNEAGKLPRKALLGFAADLSGSDLVSGQGDGVAGGA
jgi:acyl-coenzyme A synthetase/AMP-(fatty) acid ligase